MRTGSSTQRNREIVALRCDKDNPMTLQAIGEKFGITREYVRQILKAEGVDPISAHEQRLARVHEIERQKVIDDGDNILELYEDGISGDEIARRYGLQWRLVHDFLRDNVDAAIIAARNENVLSQRFPGIHAGPLKEDTDRAYWTRQGVIDALLRYAEWNEGKLGGSIAYQQATQDDDSYPSLSTVRNRGGRWRDMVVLIENKLKENENG